VKDARGEIIGHERKPTVGVVEPLEHIVGMHLDGTGIEPATPGHGPSLWDTQSRLSEPMSILADKVKVADTTNNLVAEFNIRNLQILNAFVVLNSVFDGVRLNIVVG